MKIIKCVCNGYEWLTCRILAWLGNTVKSVWSAACDASAKSVKNYAGKKNRKTGKKFNKTAASFYQCGSLDEGDERTCHVKNTELTIGRQWGMRFIGNTRFSDQMVRVDHICFRFLIGVKFFGKRPLMIHEYWNVPVCCLRWRKTVVKNDRQKRNGIEEQVTLWTVWPRPITDFHFVTSATVSRGDGAFHFNHNGNPWFVRNWSVTAVWSQKEEF